ncbi:mitochondrial 18 KDa protein-domain-containing protein [Pavlovales sp. CCMP2436]|nr:mitochondrial 18 KDa protein-domain-containing protein [Pavlovales sp. CCMP2436]|mmetsp:Transcript_15889/g.40532  ORF Transcript_15889/g.40532 Transcript_15889/m.40532 type:complete len:181 (-) Transcript_15889:171-713(-)
MTPSAEEPGYSLPLLWRDSWKDIWRDSPLRLVGYSNEVGEAFRPLISRTAVHGSYALAFAYVIGDAADKASKAGQKAKAQGEPPALQMLTTAADVISWQTIASVAVPGMIINRVVALAGFAFRRAGRPPGWGPTFIGLATVPLIVKPIDHATDLLLDMTLRPAIEQFHQRRQASSKLKER